MFKSTVSKLFLTRPGVLSRGDATVGSIGGYRYGLTTELARNCQLVCQPFRNRPLPMNGVGVRCGSGASNWSRRQHFRFTLMSGVAADMR
jgi:hypothetical protein